MSSVSEALKACWQRTYQTSFDIPILLVQWDQENPYYSLSQHDRRTPTTGLIRLRNQLICVLAADRLVAGFTQGLVATTATHAFLAIAGIDHQENISIHVSIPFEAFDPVDNLWIQLRRWIRPDLAIDHPYPSAPPLSAYVPRPEHELHLQINEVQLHLHHYAGPRSPRNILLSAVFARLCSRYDPGPAPVEQGLSPWQVMNHENTQWDMGSGRTLRDCSSEIVFSPFRHSSGFPEDVTEDEDMTEVEEDIPGC